MKKHTEEELDAAMAFMDIKTHTHAGGHSTESGAARKAAGNAAAMNRAILDMLDRHPEGLIANEISDKVDVSPDVSSGSSARRRLTDLRVAGKVRHHPQRQKRLNNNNNLEIVWVRGNDPNREASKQQLRDEIAKLERLLTSNGIPFEHNTACDKPEKIK